MLILILILMPISSPFYKVFDTFIRELLCVRSIDVVEIMDLVLGLFKISKMDEDMDKIVSCVQVIFLLMLILSLMLLLMERQC